MYFDLSDYQFPFFQISASISKQITRNHFGLRFKATEPFPCTHKKPSAGKMIPFASLLSVLLLLTSHAQRASCDDAECLDENHVFVQLRSEVRDSKTQTLAWQHIHAGAGIGVAATGATMHMGPAAPLPVPLPAPSQFAMHPAPLWCRTARVLLVFLQM